MPILGDRFCRSARHTHHPASQGSKAPRLAATKIHMATGSNRGWRDNQATGQGNPQAIAFNMDASEGTSLNSQEQLEVIARAKKLLGNGCPVISGLLTSYTSAAVDVSKRLVDLGVDGITVFAPLPVFLGTPLPSQMIIDYHVAIATAVEVPLIAFQYPLTMVNYPKGTVEEFSKVKNIVAMKEASFDVSKTSEAIEEAKSSSRRIGILTGRHLHSGSNADGM
jgi:4-hydroxy-tetrahydrodipicolinate synthase